MRSRTSTLFWLVSAAVTALAADKSEFGEACVQAHNKLAFGTYQLTTECDAAFYCADNNTCANKGCRRDDFPFGYPVGTPLPPTCGDGTFCPDEGDQCLPLIAVGAPCQLNRDDECSPPSDKSLSGPRNHNGAVCLNFQCMWSNVTSSQKCIIENTPYVVYDQSGGHEYVSIVSRDNCKPGLYCDGAQSTCLSLKAKGDSCTADKECDSYNCNVNGKCDIPTNTTIHVATWVYVIIAIAIIGGMIGVLVVLFFVHRKDRTSSLGKRSQYWREQEAFRSNILAMREQARVSMLSLPRGNSHQSQASETSQTAMLYAAAKPSGLRSTPYADDRDSMEESLVPQNYASAYGGTVDDSRRRTRTSGRF